MLDLNIVIINYFSKDDVIKAVSSLFADLADSKYSFQITLVDNSGNQDGVKYALQTKFPEVVYINSGGNIGFGKANNLGFKAAPARYYFALNCDAYVPQGEKTVDRIIKFMDENPKIGCVGPKILNFDGSLQYSCYRFNASSILIKPVRQTNWIEKNAKLKRYADELIMKNFDHEKTMPVDWVLGAAMFVRHEAAEQVGWFDSRFFMYFEDCDWCLRMWEKGWPVYYLHNVKVYHKYGRESSKTPGTIFALVKNKMARIHLYSWLRYIWKWRKVYKFYS